MWTSNAVVGPFFLACGVWLSGCTVPPGKAELLQSQAGMHIWLFLTISYASQCHVSHGREYVLRQIGTEESRIMTFECRYRLCTIPPSLQYQHFMFPAKERSACLKVSFDYLKLAGQAE